MADLQRAVQALLDELVESGEEVGLQAAVYVEGQRAADCVAGWRSQDRETPVSEDTLFTIYSSTKGVTASTLHILAERGLIDYERPVVEYWPEFAHAGKGSGSVAQPINSLSGSRPCRRRDLSRQFTEIYNHECWTRLENHECTRIRFVSIRGSGPKERECGSKRQVRFLQSNKAVRR